MQGWNHNSVENTCVAISLVRRGLQTTVRNNLPKPMEMINAVMIATILIPLNLWLKLKCGVSLTTNRNIFAKSPIYNNIDE